MQSIEIEADYELAKRNFHEKFTNCVSSTTENVGPGVICFNRRSSVIKSPCKYATVAKFFKDKLANEIVLTHKQYTQTEQENISLNHQTEDLDRLLKQQDYEFACLKYDLEKIRQTKIALTIRLGDEVSKANNAQNYARKFVQSEVEQVPSSTITMNEHDPAQVTHHHNLHFHKADREKQPEIYCVCGVKFTTKQNLREHIKYNTFRTNFNCNVCGIWKHGLNQLRTHMKVTHGISSAYLASLKGCRLCGKLFTTLAQIHEHRRTQHRETRKRERKTVKPGEILS